MNKRHPRRRAKRARIGDGSSTASALEPSTTPDWRDWGSLACGPAMLIADRLLSADVADYIRFRAACSAWRRCTADPHVDALDRRFHPRSWTMLPDVVRRRRGVPPRYRYSRFANVSTSERIRMTIRGLDGRDGRTYLARTSQGLLVLLSKNTDDIWVVNPITGAFAHLPPVTTLLDGYSRDLIFFRRPEEVHFNAELTDDSAVVINIGGHKRLGVARPGDEHWTKVESERRISSFVVLAGRVYCMSGKIAMVLETSPDHPPRLVEADNPDFI
uniref:Uncharacterized protein n=1 Tax=Avena sativa TaxID=4498 RepID=A0ACD5U8A8_AVESA